MKGQMAGKISTEVVSTNYSMRGGLAESGQLLNNTRTWCHTSAKCAAKKLMEGERIEKKWTTV